jgi:dUTP diphosphatase
MNETLRVKLLRDGAKMPWRATEGSTGYDLYACIEGAGYMDLGPDVTLVPTGVAIEIPAGYDVQVRPRSGLGRQGVDLVLGTIDSDYRGELLVSLRTFGTRTSYRINHGDRIAQLVVSRMAEVELIQVEELGESGRSVGGHGSTGR